MSQAVEPKIRGAVVGAGHMGQYHILALAEIWGVELVGVVDTDFAKAQQVAAPYGARAYRDHRELAGQIDFATVAVPTEQHFEVARDLLEAGAHVLVEKPMTATLEEGKELFRIAREQRTACSTWATSSASTGRCRSCARSWSARSSSSRAASAPSWRACRTTRW